jgi:hypothetical protein
MLQEQGKFFWENGGQAQAPAANILWEVWRETGRSASFNLH